MEQRTYSKNINVAQIAQTLQNHFMSQGYKAQVLGNSPNMLVQVRKKGVLRAVTGIQRAMSAQFRETPEGIVITLGEQKWADKAAVGVVGAIIFAPLIITAAYGAYKQSKLPEQFWQIIDSYAMPATDMATMEEPALEQTVPPTAEPNLGTEQMEQIPKFCPDCGTLQEGTKYCSNCGRKHFQ